MGTRFGDEDQEAHGVDIVRVNFDRDGTTTVISTRVTTETLCIGGVVT